MTGEHVRHRGWELHLEWVWDQLEDAERGRIRVAPDILALAAVAAVKAHIAEAAPVYSSRPAEGSTARHGSGGRPDSGTTEPGGAL